MKNKFIRVLQPLSVLFLVLLDAASVLLLIPAIKRITDSLSFYSAAFLLIDLVVFVSALMSTLQSLKNGIVFSETSLVFTALDSNNVYKYTDIEKAEGVKDSKASFKKNFVDRYSSVILYLKDGSVATIELGFTTKKKLRQIISEIEKRCSQ